MQRWLVVVLVAACHRGATPPPASPSVPAPTVARLRPPPVLDLNVRGSAYLGAVALQLQPGWGQFLDDCRLRLPATHALNDMALAATVDIAIDARGQVVDSKITSSGNADFDRAVSDALRDVNPLPAPPHDLWSDDDRVHLRWLFARDRRQAGPATATIVDVDLPIEGVVDRLVMAHDLGRAARRIAREPATTARDRSTRKLAVAGLREAIDSSDNSVRRSAVDAVNRADVAELAPDVRALLTATNDDDLRLVAIQAAAALGDDASAAVIFDQMTRRDLLDNHRLAKADMQALVALHHETDLIKGLRNLLKKVDLYRQQTMWRRADLPVIEGVGLVEIPEVKSQVGAWITNKDARTREAACSALANQPADDKQVRAWLVKGMADRDAGVRAACAAAVRDPAVVRTQLRSLVKDRDALVRAAAVRQLAALAGEKLANIANDAAPDVRSAYASTCAPNHPDVQKLLADLDPDVRAAAWRTFVKSDDRDKATLAQQAVRDPAEQVRAAAVPAIGDDSVIADLSKSDVSGDVRTAAIVEVAGRRGRAAIEGELLQRFADAPPASAERVRTMLAWLLAR